MKKLILLVAAVTGLGSLNAQSIGKGAIQLGGTVGFATASEKPLPQVGQTFTSREISSFVFNVTPRAAFFITDDISVGLGFGFDNNGSRKTVDNYAAQPFQPAYSTTSETVNSNIVIAPSVNYYKMLNDQFGLYAGLGVGIGFGSTETKNSTSVSNTVLSTKGSTSSFNVGVSPGVIFFPAPKWAIHAQLTNGLGFMSMTQKDKDDKEISSGSGFGLNLGLSSVNFGVSYFIGRGE